jgi:hypothetical protein
LPTWPDFCIFNFTVHPARVLIQFILSCILFFMSCKKEEPPVNVDQQMVGSNVAPVSPDTCPDYVAFGKYVDFRMINLYEQQYEFYCVCNSGVFEDTTYFPHPYIGNPFHLFQKLEAQDFLRVKMFENYIPVKLLTDSTTQFGNIGFCQVFYVISVHKNGLDKRFLIDGSPGANVPEFLNPIRDTIELYTKILK